MDMNFHFYAVKVIALLSGFDPFEAMVIADSSQYTDDYFTDEAYALEGVPAFARMLMQGDKFKTVPTGFTVMNNGIGLLQQANQKNYIIPFHFIPPYYRRTGHDYKVIRAHLGDKYLINQLLDKAARSYKESGSADEKLSGLIRMGITLHIFADTYAHENFNGYSSDANSARVVSAQENHRKERTHDYAIYNNLPKVGHACVGTAPDESCIEFALEQGSTGEIRWGRDNTRDFKECAYEILKYLTEIKRGVSPDNKDQMDAMLDLGFTEASPAKWENTWENAWEAYRGALPEYHDFHYSRVRFKTCLQPFKSSQGTLRANPFFYYYNYNAYLIRETVKQILTDP